MAREHAATARLIIAAVLAFAALAGLVIALQRFGQLARSNPEPILRGMFQDGLVIGIASMAIIQILRYLFPVRGAFHLFSLTRANSHRFAKPVSEAISEFRTRPSSGTYDLPVEHLIGQLSGFVNAKLAAEPTREPEDVRGRVAVEDQCRRDLDQLQIDITSRWRRMLRASALVLSALLAVAWQFGTTEPSTLNVLPVVFVALLGGFVATVSRDVVAVIEKLRR